MLVLQEVALVNASAAAAGAAAVTRPRDAYRHMFLVTLTAAGSVWVEAAVMTVAPAPLRWVPISGAVTVTDSIAVEGNFTNLRVSWAGNADTVTVDLIRSAQQPAVY
jgi:hypothetical protein